MNDQNHPLDEPAVGIRSARHYFDLDGLEPTLAELFRSDEDVWQALDRIDDVLAAFFASGAPRGDLHRGEVHPAAVLGRPDRIYIGAGATVEAGAVIAGPAYIGAGCEVRQGAYVRGAVIAGAGSVLGHASELKNAILLPGSLAPHFAYVGDSILGRDVNLGAGTKLSNLGVHSRPDAGTGARPTIRITLGGREVDTGRAKLGAILGDGVQLGCNVVTNPGCLVGPGTLVYANVSLGRGYWEPGKIVKLRQQLVVTDRRA